MQIHNICEKTQNCLEHSRVYTYAYTKLRRLVLWCGVGPPLTLLSLSQYATAMDYPPTAVVSTFCKTRSEQRQGEGKQENWEVGENAREGKRKSWEKIYICWEKLNTNVSVYINLIAVVRHCSLVVKLYSAPHTFYSTPLHGVCVAGATSYKSLRRNGGRKLDTDRWCGMGVTDDKSKLSWSQLFSIKHQTSYASMFIHTHTHKLSSEGR